MTNTQALGGLCRILLEKELKGFANRLPTVADRPSLLPITATMFSRFLSSPSNAQAGRPQQSSLVLSAAVMMALAFGPLATKAQAQDDKVYTMAELTNPPKLSSSTNAAKLIQDSYPEDLKRKKVGGLVELQFVVDAQGNVIASSVEVVDATQTALGEAAKKMAARLMFEPGKLNGTKVKAKVVLPVVYKTM